MSLGTVFDPRTSPLNEKRAWQEWWGYHTPLSYADSIDVEYNAVRENAGVIDVSPLFKYRLSGPDAVRLIDRVITRDANKLQVDQICYTPWCDERGKIVDDGTVARLGDDLFYVTTTSSGSDSVLEWFEWWNAVWGYDAEIVNVTGALAAVNLAGPQAREALGALTDADVSNDALKYLDAKEITVAGVPCLALRCVESEDFVSLVEHPVQRGPGHKSADRTKVDQNLEDALRCAAESVGVA